MTFFRSCIQGIVFTVMPAVANFGASSPGSLSVIMVCSKALSKGSMRRSMFSQPPFPRD